MRVLLAQRLENEFYNKLHAVIYRQFGPKLCAEFYGRIYFQFTSIDDFQMVLDEYQKACERRLKAL